jgi:predicted MPP superfamily phosphohydrolase
VAQLADLHTHGLGRRERALLAILERERPDLIVPTGDQVLDGEPGAPPPGAGA